MKAARAPVVRRRKTRVMARSRFGCRIGTTGAGDGQGHLVVPGFEVGVGRCRAEPEPPPSPKFQL